MELVSSRDAIEFLSRSAPRPWVKRLLFALIIQDELDPYFQEGRSVARISKFAAIVETMDASRTLEEARASIDKDFLPDIAAKLHAAGDHDEISEEVYAWNAASEGPRSVMLGYFLYATRIDWESGVLELEIDGSHGYDSNLFELEPDLMSSSFKEPDFEITLRGLCFQRSSIELLQPGIEFVMGSETKPVAAKIGRPRVWDWDGALTSLLVVAQTPDGLPTGPGAQAEIERLIADWFVSQTGNAPAESEIRKHASKILRSITKA